VSCGLLGRDADSERSARYLASARAEHYPAGASMSMEGMGPSLAVEGATTATVLETYIKKVLAPSLRPGQLVVMDNLSAHKGAFGRKLIEERDCELVHLPPYSPDLNPIEEAFSKMKGILRKVGARSREALIEAMGHALDAITSPDAKGFFESSSTVDTVQ
jgi:transposase